MISKLEILGQRGKIQDSVGLPKRLGLAVAMAGPTSSAFYNLRQKAGCRIHL